MSARGARALGAAAVLTAGVSLAGSLPAGHRAAPYLVAHFVLAGLSLFAWHRARALGSTDARERFVRTLVLAGILCRVALVFAPSFTTTDVARYLWDGAVVLDGRDPYDLAPNAAALGPLRARFPAPTDHLDVATCYPPAALGLFAAAASFGGAWAFLAWKALVLAASSLTVWVVWSALRRTDESHHAVLAALFPLPMLEAGVGAHLDTFTALSVAVALASARAQKWERAALAAGFAGALKLLPGLVALPLFFASPRKLRFVALSTVPLSLSLGLSQLAGHTPPGSLPMVAIHWSFASPLWSAIYQRYPEDDDTIRPALALAGLCAALLFSLRGGNVSRNARDAFGASLVTSPVLYPWYGAPFAAAWCFAPNAWGALVLSALPLSYEVLDGYQAFGRWEPAKWPVHTIAAMMVLGVLADAGLRLWSRRAEGARQPRERP